MKNLFILILFLFYSSAFAQKTFTIQIYEERISGNRDCDGFALGDSDPTWRFNAGPGWDCVYRNGNNTNFTIGDVLNVASFTWNCPGNQPGNINLDFRGCENDNVANCPNDVTGCDGGQATGTVAINPSAFGVGTTNLNGGAEYCFTVSGGCYNGVVMCFKARVIVSGAFYNNSNDDLCNASNLGTINISGSSSLNNQNNLCATLQAGEPGSGYGLNNTVWYKFTTGATIGQSSTITVNENGDDFRGEVNLYSSNVACPTFGQLSFIAQGEAGVGSGNTSFTANCLQPNTTYWIQVDGKNCTLGGGSCVQGQFNVNVTDNGGLRSGPNDIACAATNINTAVGNATMDLSETLLLNSQSNVCAGTEAGEPSPNGANKTVWYTVTTGATIGQSVTIDVTDTGGDNIDLELALFSGGCSFGSMSTLASESGDNVGDISNDEQLNYDCLLPNTTYYIQVDGSGCTFSSGCNEGDFSIQVKDNGGTRTGTYDNICNATAVAVGGCINGVNTCATVQGGEVSAGGSISPSRTTWHYFTAPASGHVIVSTNNGTTNFDTEIALWASSAGVACPTFGQLSLIDSDDDIVVLINLKSELEVTCLVPGNRYYVQVDGDDVTDFGNYSLCVTSVGPPIAPNNLSCSATAMGTLNLATTLTQNNQNNNCADVSAGEPSPNTNNQTVWYTYTTGATVGNAVTINAIDAGSDNIDLELALYQGGCAFASMNLLASESGDNFGDVSNDESLTYDCLQPSTTYYIQVDGSTCLLGGCFEGDFNLNVVDNGGARVGTYDNICNATSVAVGGCVTGVNSCATVQAGEVSAGGSISPSRTTWHYFTAPVSGHVRVSTDNGTTNFDTEIALWASSAGVACPTFGQLSLVDSDDDIVVLINEKSELEVECLVPGQRYYVQVDGDDVTDFGNYSLCVTNVGPPIASNNLICNATAMGTLNLGGTVSVSNQNNYCANSSAGEPAPFSLDATVWYSFTTGANPGARTDFSVVGAGGDAINLQIALYTSSNSTCSGTLNLVQSDYDGILTDEDMSVECLRPNTTYFVQIDGEEWSFLTAYEQGLFNLTIVDNGIPQPTNDNICNAVSLGVLTLGGTISDTRPANARNNFCATAQVGEVDPPATNSLLGVNWGPDKTIWYKFTTPPGNCSSGAYPGKEVLISAVSDPNNLGDEMDLQIALYEAVNPALCTFPNLVHVGNDYNPDVPLFWTGEDLYQECLKPNTTYYIQVDGSGVNMEGFLGISVTDDGFNRGRNDDICCATNLGTIPNGGPGWPGAWTSALNQNNVCATRTALETTGGTQMPATWTPEQSVWYSFVPPASGNVEITMTTPFNLLDWRYIDSQIAIYQSSNNTCSGTMQLLDDLDDLLGADIDNGEFIIKCLDPSKTYFIQCDGWEEPTNLLGWEEGVFDIKIRDYSPSAPNDSICNAIAINGSLAGGQLANGQTVSLINQQNFCADNILEPIPSSFGTTKTIWYTFKAPPSGRVMIRGFSDPQNSSLVRNPVEACDDIDIQMAVYDHGLPSNACICTGQVGGTIFEVDSDYNDYDPLTGPGEGLPLISGDGGFGCSLIPPTQQYDEYMQLNCLIPGRCYYLMIDGADGLLEQFLNASDGFFDIEIEALPGPGPITNDNVCNAIPLGTPPNGGFVQTAPGTHNRCATTEPLETTNNLANNALVALPPDFDMDRTVWFSFVAPASGRVNLNVDSDPGGTFSDGIDIQVAAYASSNNSCDYNTFSLIRAEYEGLGVVYDEDMELNCLIPGNTYYVQIDGADIDGSTLIDDQEGFFRLRVEHLAPLPTYGNDNVCAAQNLGTIPLNGASAVTPGSNYCATVETGEPNVDPGNAWDPLQGTDESVWFKFTTSGAPGAITVELTNVRPGPLSPPFYELLGFAPNINVYQSTTGLCNFADFIEVAANDNILPLIDISTTISCPFPNTTYYVQIDGLDLVGDFGEFDIQVSDDGNTVIRPTNDNMCNALPMGLTLNSGNVQSLTNQNNFCASEETGEPNVSGTTVTTDIDYDETVWYYFTTGPNPGIVTVATTNTNPFLFWTNLTVYMDQNTSTCTYPDLVEVDNASANILNGNATLDLTCLRPNTRYYFQVDATDALNITDNFGTFDISVTDNGVPNIYPGNDDFCNTFAMDGVSTGFGGQTPLPSGGTQTRLNQTNSCATQEQLEQFVSSNSTPLNDFNRDETVWYSFTTSATPGTITITVNPTSLDPAINVYTYPGGDCSVGLDDLVRVSFDNNIDGGNLSLVMRCLDPLTKYFIQLDGTDILDDQGNFNISVSDDGIPSFFQTNDDICNATNFGVVALGGATPVTAGNNSCASEETGEPNTSGSTILTDANYDETLWYKFTTSATPGSILINLTGSTISPIINLYQATTSSTCSFSSLTFLRSAQNVLPNSNTSLTYTCPPANTTFYVQIDGLDNVDDRGGFNIRISDDGTPDISPTNNNICSATALGGVYPININNQNNYCANTQAGEPNVQADDETVWYSFIAPTSGRVTVNMTSVTGIDINFSIYGPATGCSFSGLDQVGSNHDDLISFNASATETCLQPGQLYYIQVDGGDIFGDNGVFNINMVNADLSYSGPVNNNCAGAINLSVGTSPCQGTGLWNVQNYGWAGPTDPPTAFTQPSCGQNCGDTWYSFTMPATGYALIEGNDEYGPLGATSSTMGMSAYSGTCGSLSPLNCQLGGIGSDPTYYVSGAPGSTVFIQVFSNNGAPLISNTFGICVSTRCGPDSCNNSAVMVTYPIPQTYCWNTNGATGENIAGSVPGYQECGDGSDPDNSVYYRFFTGECGIARVSLSGVIKGDCVLGIPFQGLNISLFQDATPCDRNPEQLLDCDQFDVCQGTIYNFNQVYSGLLPNHQYVVMIDGFDPVLDAADHQGTITIGTDCPFPIELLNLVGYNDENVNQLDWNVTEVSNVNYFEVEKSADAVSFSYMAQVDGTDFTQLQQGAKKYHATDFDPIRGKNYYRLKMVDTDGMINYSNVVEVDFASNFTQAISLYPNPAKDWITLDMVVGENANYEVVVQDVLGKQVFSKNLNLTPGSQSVNFDVSKLSAGMYMFNIYNRDENLTKVIKFIKSN